MAPESCRTSVFTFQSSVHSSHVLSCLEEQRQKDLLCDVTVVTENRSFRAHRSVLASCSEYFSARVFGQTAPGLVLNLPDEVTAEGFEPLLQFAYTSKLLFTKENVLEVRNCAAALGFKNLDGACFDFLLPKFFSSSGVEGSHPAAHRKRCCRDARKDKSHAPDITDDASPPPDPAPAPPGGDPSASEVQERYYRCPKYTKFLQACGRAQARVDPQNICARTRLPCSGPGTSQTAAPAPTSPETCPIQSLCSGQICPMIASCGLRGFDRASPPSKDVEDSPPGFSRAARPGSPHRSDAEMEAANQLSTWPAVCSLQPALSSLQCPFLRDQDGGGGASPVPDECPYVSSVNSDSDEDSGSSDSDSEKAREMQLPLPVERVTSMSRNDFQNFVRTYRLTREQLDYVHDVRRRCKNRIAARRCRKRKLDCIYNLEREINRLRSERETLTAEKLQLEQTRLSTSRRCSVLYHRLCAEADLGPEQLQLLAEYTSLVECPFSAHMSTGARAYRCPGPQVPPLEPGPGAEGGQPENGGADQRNVLDLGDS